MQNSNVAIIRRVLAGDETAFAELVNKYQKPVHALAWRKVGDFHIAEDITQDTFLKVYQRLHTLKDPSQFSGWIYVITANLCATWLRKKRIQTQPLEGTKTTMIQEDAYSRHVTEERRRAAVAAQREVVKKLLAQLKESERTVMTLYYLGEMKVEEISRFLGVSASTIKSRLRRARNRLKEEEPMIREALDHFQMTPNLTENIMREISRLKPVVPSGNKPVVPWAVAGFTVAIVLLMLGIGNQHLSRFQKPYSFDASSEMTVEIIEAPVVLNLEAKPDIRTQLGNSTVFHKNDGAGQRPDEVLFAAAQAEGENMSDQKQHWIHAKPVKGAPARNLCTTPEGDLYVITNYRSVYRLPKDGNTWQHLRSIDKLKTDWGGAHSIAKWNNTLYFVPHNELFTSTDGGETWDLLYSWEGEKYGFPIELVLTGRAFYLTFRNGVFRSEDNGKTWKNISDGLMERFNGGRHEYLINAFIVIQNTLFAGTENGFYRYSGGSWKRLGFPIPIERVVSTATTEGKLYVVAGFDWNVSQKLKRTWGIFRSTDLGDSWKDITPTNAWHSWLGDGVSPNITLIAVGETLLAMEQGMVRSIDGGDTWLSPQAPGTSPLMSNLSSVAVVKKDTIYIGSYDGLHYSTDLGESWHKMNIKQKRGHIYDLIAFKKTDKDQSTPALLYAKVEGETVSGNEIQKTDDGGNSWIPVQIANPMTEPHREVLPNITQIIKDGDALYAKGKDNIFPSYKTRIYRVSSDSRTLVPIQGMPIFNSEKLDEQLSEGRALGATQFFKQLTQPEFGHWDDLIRGGLRGAFAVNDDTFYMEYNYKLFRWTLGDTEWYDTEQEETVELTPNIAELDLKLAVSGNTVYVGKRDGRFVTSLDMGNTWLDLTPALPFSVKIFKDIVFTGSIVYVATDAGVAASSDGKQWRAITDAGGTSLIIGRLAVDGTKVYGVSKSGAYRLENDTWRQIASEVPERVTSLAVDGKVLYVGTRDSGVLHFNLEE